MSDPKAAKQGHVAMDVELSQGICHVDVAVSEVSPGCVEQVLEHSLLGRSLTEYDVPCEKQRRPFRVQPKEGSRSLVFESRILPRGGFAKPFPPYHRLQGSRNCRILEHVRKALIKTTVPVEHRRQLIPRELKSLGHGGRLLKPDDARQLRHLLAHKPR